MPRETQTADSQGTDSSGSAANAQATDTRPGGGLGVPIDTPDPLAKYKWFILGGITLVFAVGAGFMLSRPAEGSVTEAVAVPSAGGVLAALKDELFALETDHLQGRLSDSEYEQQKQALELVLRRALQRANPTAHTPELISR